MKNIEGRTGIAVGGNLSEQSRGTTNASESGLEPRPHGYSGLVAQSMVTANPGLTNIETLRFYGS